MPRVSGVDIPADKKVKVALTYIYGLGDAKSLELLKQAKVDPEKRVNKLTDSELAAIQKAVTTVPVEGALRKLVNESIKRLKQINTYRGIRHSKGLPVRGQSTRHNARTRKGKRKTVGAMKKTDMQKMEEAKKAKESKAKK